MEFIFIALNFTDIGNKNAQKNSQNKFGFENLTKKLRFETPEWATVAHNVSPDFMQLTQGSSKIWSQKLSKILLETK